ncbi:MAG: DUF4258 domain-containing protein [Planctomycetota bacterium]
MDELRIDVMTPLGFRVVCSSVDWQRIAGIKHPPMRGRIRDVERTLTEPDEIRLSRKDPEVMLFHRRQGERWVSAVVHRGRFVGRLITAYPADKVKQGDLLWRR